MAPKVGIIMGSDSDLPVMKEAAKILEEFGVEYEITIVSAHRTPERMYEYAKRARERGIEVIIAGAGGAAHLPGMTASITTLPVIGVPVKSRALNGLDSLLSIVQMPAGVPVATVAINNAKNAALLALRILSIKYPEIAEKLEKYMEDMRRTVEEKAKRLEEVGWAKYLGEDD
ncbi:5-(carboxyamino)imidazole ribonucleotide mutase [Pyrococcus kukulkanii]|uniref:N5-carboxyaminoimidazole ribonucleotide mutase n=1 Tax=Pyrococcus kukulkanii TaxID=1609559 RepID=A0A127B8H9_9EURY|nr:5-(carboxyamino)imidazole ribonucleotide mutase [Pyrococcus kukulkanii]AMM53683.1 N5-carboxyaminoimidazole ribonucleotide mutase [Pyrococcus kukulkanii]